MKKVIAMSVYDNKPVHFLTMAAESIKWIIKTRLVYSKASRQMEEIKFLRVNVNNDYNFKMNPVDIADQLRNQYIMDHWLRQRKWWWSIFLWGVGVLLTNSYIVYCKVQEKSGVTKRLSHYDYLHAVAVNWIDTEEVDMKELHRIRKKKRKQKTQCEANESVNKRQRGETTTATPTTGTTPMARGHSKLSAMISPPKSSSKAPRLNDKSIDSHTGLLRCRLEHLDTFHCPEPSACKIPSCALHRWIFGRQNGCHGQLRHKVVSCSVCQVNLCIPCFKVFHTVDNLEEYKKQELLDCANSGDASRG